jgi:tetratricopeptide (TPR) repeat protein
VPFEYLLGELETLFLKDLIKNATFYVKILGKEKLSVRAKENDNCWGCHMPKSGTIDIPHVTVTDHWIRVPMKKEAKNDIKEFVGIYCINNPGSDAFTKGNAYLSYYEKFEAENHALDSASMYLQEVKGLGEDDLFQARIHLLYLKQDYEGMLRLVKNKEPATFKNPWTLYRIGQAYQNLGYSPKAQVWYEQAVNLAPANLDFINKLGAILVEQEKLDEGILLLEKSLKLNPKQQEPLSNLGFAYLKTGNTQLAMQYYDASLALNPDFEQALLNKAGLYNYLGNQAAAKKILKEMVKRNPQNQVVKQLLNQL